MIFAAHFAVPYVHTYMLQYCNSAKYLTGHEAVNSGATELMDRVNMNRGKSTVWWENVLNCTLQSNWITFCVNIMSVYMSFQLQIFVYRLSQFQHLMTALYYSQIKNSSTVL